MVATLALLAGACSDGDDKADETTTTKVEDATTTTLNDDDYTDAITEYTASVEEAGTDLCSLSGALTSSPPSPGNEAQSKQLIELYAKLLRTLAAAVPDDPASAQTFNTTADTLLSEAEAAGYPIDFLSNGENPPAALTSEEFSAANTAIAAKVQTQCAPTDTTVGDTTEPTTTVAG
jgi:hypothetical protein